MMGGMLAGHDQCTGEVIEKNGKKYKLFYGMSSDTAMKKYVGGVAEYRWETSIKRWIIITECTTDMYSVWLHLFKKQNCPIMCACVHGTNRCSTFYQWNFLSWCPTFSLLLSGRLRGEQWRFRTEETWRTPSVTCWGASAPPAHMSVPPSSKSWAEEPPSSASHNSPAICSLSRAPHYALHRLHDMHRTCVMQSLNVQ